MMRLLRAHGFDPGPAQRPMLAGGLTALISAMPAAAVFVAFGSFRVAADEVMGRSRPVTAAILLIAVVLAGAIYGRLFGRAANDRQGGWLFGLAYGFVLWIAAPVVVLPLVAGRIMAAGRPAEGFLVALLFWGLLTGLLFPFVHRPLHAHVKDGDSRKIGSNAAARRGWFGDLRRRDTVQD
jgi:hypothetical protein